MKTCSPPWQIQWVAVGDHFDDLSINRNAIIPNSLHISIKGAKHGIIFQEVSCLLDTTRVIDGNNFQRRVLPPMPAADEIPSNSSKAIDGNLDFCLHNCLLLSRVCCLSKQKKTATQSVSLVVASITLELYYGSSSQLAFWCKACKEWTGEIKRVLYWEI